MSTKIASLLIRHAPGAAAGVIMGVLWVKSPYWPGDPHFGSEATLLEYSEKNNSPIVERKFLIKNARYYTLPRYYYDVHSVRYVIALKPKGLGLYSNTVYAKATENWRLSFETNCGKYPGLKEALGPLRDKHQAELDDILKSFNSKCRDEVVKLCGQHGLRH